MATGGKRTSTSVADRIVESALALAAEEGWLSLSMGEVAHRAGVPIGEAFAVFPSTSAVLEAFLERVERDTLAAAAPDFAESARDRLFDVVMARFDALAPHKGAIAALVRELPGDPLALVLLMPRFGARLARLLEAAGLSSTGPLGALRVQGLAVIYLGTLRVWLADDSPDMARTMAALDRGLRRAEALMRTASGLLPGFRPAERAPARETAAPPLHTTPPSDSA